ncbi:MAG TPA: glycosyltransferase family 4 protein [Sphingomonas sanguinis]|uniref:glycosyltransferase family 4 protein n=1 Tax=Sphingomonas sanguinis TaxID=33051 RepID=UPI002AC13A73|nr:glycosyltransferase family 4 protein [Sphingomonas sanguinis]
MPWSCRPTHRLVDDRPGGKETTCQRGRTGRRVIGKQRIVIYDIVSQAPYSAASLGDASVGIGGAENTVIHIATGLAKVHDVTVLQSARQGGDRIEDGGVTWASTEDAEGPVTAADVIILQRKSQPLVRLARWNRRARYIVWMHDWQPVEDRSVRGGRWKRGLKAEARSLVARVLGVQWIGVSRAHVGNIRAFLAADRLTSSAREAGRVGFIYNPVVIGAAPADTAYDRNRLVFFSAAWKGLDLVLKAFAAVRSAMPDMELRVASPAYDLGEGQCQEGVVMLGPLPQDRVFAEVQQALCVFYPADRVPETFGLVFAESHALGTPVLAHDFGAATELLGPDERMDVTDTQAVVERVRAWRDGARPKVKAHDACDLDRVVDQWLALIAADPKAPPPGQ